MYSAWFLCKWNSVQITYYSDWYSEELLSIDRAAVGGPVHGLTTFSATKTFFNYSLPFEVIATFRQHFDTTWPDHFSEADYDPDW